MGKGSWSSPRIWPKRVAVEAEEMEQKERFITEKIRAGASIVGTYPPDEQTLAEYQAWKTNQS